MGYEEDMNSALADLESGEFSLISEAARKWGVHCSTLSRRFRNKSTSRAEANSTYCQCLTTAQEDTLIYRINYLTRRNLSPTPKIVKNLAEEIGGREVSKNWVDGFVKRYSTRLLSKYLRTINKDRSQQEKISIFKHFFNTVE